METERKVYIAGGNTYHHKETLKSWGWHWDPDRKAWVEDNNSKEDEPCIKAIKKLSGVTVEVITEMVEGYLPDRSALTKPMKPYLSTSQLNMLWKCPEQYRRRYIEGHRIPPGVSMIVGRATDKSVNANLGNKIVTEQLLPEEQVTDIARDAFNMEWDNSELLLTPEETELGIKKVKGKNVDKSVRLAKLHHKDKAPKLEPTIIQRKFVVELEGYPRDLVGYIDIQEGDKALRDTKTAAKKPTMEWAATDDQLTLYALGKWVVDEHRLAEMVVLDYLVDKKVPEAFSIASTRNLQDFEVMLRRVEAAIELIEKQAWIPTNPTNWWCSPKYCGYFDTCKYVKASRPVVVLE